MKGFRINGSHWLVVSFVCSCVEMFAVSYVASPHVVFLMDMLPPSGASSVITLMSTEHFLVLNWIYKGPEVLSRKIATCYLWPGKSRGNSTQKEEMGWRKQLLNPTSLVTCSPQGATGLLCAIAFMWGHLLHKKNKNQCYILIYQY